MQGFDGFFCLSSVSSSETDYKNLMETGKHTKKVKM